MSVLISFKVPGDLDVFTKSLDERADEFRQLAEKAQAAGAVHHQFALGPDYVMVVDEWDTVEHFQGFFGAPELQAFIGEIGGDSSAPPDFTIGTCVDSADKF
jgi:quinol monooxygenase YgiN